MMMIIKNIIALFIFSSIDCLIYVYNTDDSQSVDYYDCIYHDPMFYCRRPNESIRLQRGNQSWNCLNDGIRHSFRSLSMNDANVSTILHEWKSGVDKAEEYSYYRTELLDSIDGEKYLCQCNSSRSFGQHCEYLLPTKTGKTFADAATEKLIDNSVTLMHGGDIVCYKTLECDYGLLCLDWRDICNGIQNCMFGYDEENCDKIEFNECEDDEYRCMNGMCIPDQYFLDGEYDCMDLSDEKQRFDDSSCSSQLASFNCDDRICPLNHWSCGDGQCIEDRLAFQKESAITCKNRRDRMFFCETNTNGEEKLWTLPNGQCTSAWDYEETNAIDGNLEDYCTYLLRCYLSEGLEKNCPCKGKVACNELLRNNCSALIPIQYPKGALIAPYIYNYYNLTFEPNLSYEQIYRGNGTLKCRGYMSNLPYQTMIIIPKMMNLQMIEFLFCQFKSAKTNFSNEGYHQFCHNDSQTYNNHSYHFIDVCEDSKDCISAYRINDGISDCKSNLGDEYNAVLATNSCFNVRRHRFRCSIDQSTCLYANSLGDGKSDCKNSYDEFWKDTHISLSAIICDNQNRDSCQLLRDYIEASWESNIEKNSTSEHSLSKHISFRSYCDTVWDSSSNQDENLANCREFWKCPKDKFQCYSGQCIYPKWRLDGVWDCPDASDEVNLFIFNLSESDHNYQWIQGPDNRENFKEKYNELSFAKMCNYSNEYPCWPIDISNYSNNNRFCIDLKLIGDSRIDCLGGHDERNTINHCNESSVLGYHYKCLSTNTCIPYSLLCTSEHRCPNRADDELWCKHYKNGLQSKEFTCDNGTVIINSTCNNIPDCSNGEDEYMCPRGQSSDNDYRKQRQLSIRTEQQLQELQLPSFPVDRNVPSASDPENSIIEIGPIVPPDPIDSSSILDSCNRGIGVLISNGSTICFCPPQYHGDQCQYHSDRIAFYFHLNFSQSIYSSSTDKNLLIKLVILFFNENQILNTQEVHIRPASEIDIYKKRRLHFHYSRSLQALKLKQQRYANRSNIITEHPYSILIEAYEMKIHEKPRRFAVWKYPIYFDYLPVHRLAKVLRLTESKLCKNNLCNQNQECYELINQTSKYICLCKPNYYGPDCQDADPMCQNNYCSLKALCQPSYRGLSNGQEYPYCICPFNHNGQRCELVQSACLQNPCRNGGTCSQRTRVNEFGCECTAEYEGAQCENRKEAIYLPIVNNSTITYDAVVVQYLKIDLKTLEIKLSNQSVHSDLPDLLFYLYDEKSAPEITLLKIYMNSSEDAEIYLLSLQTNNVTTSITEENRCHHMNNLFPDHSVYKYHYYCNTNQSLLCFRDDAYLCICEEDHKRAECFNYDYKLDHCSKCQANGRCFKGGKDEYLCRCPPCHIGKMCQFNFESFSFTLDQLFFNELLSINSLTQRITYSLLIIIPSLFFLFGLINNLFCLITFRRSKCLKNGIGQYLFCTTIINQINLTFLLIRFVHLTVNISHTYSSPLVNEIMCKISSYLLISTTRIIYWFSSLIAIERLYVTLFFSGNWLKKPHTARRLILVIIISTLITTADEFAFIKSQISSDDGHNSMCVLNFPDNHPFWKIWHIVITSINASIPFLINLSCTTAIIFAVAKKKIKLNQRDTSSIKVIKPSPLKTSNRFRLAIDLLIENKESLVAPAFTVIPQIFSLPFFIASFLLDCRNLHESRLQYLLIASYMTTFIPQLISFFLYISPSSLYLQEWHATRISQRLISLKKRLRISNR